MNTSWSLPETVRFVPSPTGPVPLSIPEEFHLSVGHQNPVFIALKLSSTTYAGPKTFLVFNTNPVVPLWQELVDGSIQPS